MKLLRVRWSFETYPFPGVQKGMRHIRGLGHIDQELRVKSALKALGECRACEIGVDD
jgi:hypothetical protein